MGQRLQGMEGLLPTEGDLPSLREDEGLRSNRCIGSCDPFFCRKTQAVVDVTCKDCPHNDSAQGEAAGLHHRFCHCVFDKRKDTGRMKGTSPKSLERSSSSEPSSTRGLVS